MTKPKIQLHMVMNTIDDKRFDIAITRIARYYENEMYDEYEDAIAYYADRFGLDENFIEDAAMDLYYYGPDCGQERY